MPWLEVLEWTEHYRLKAEAQKKAQQEAERKARSKRRR